jgi:hypothetical protein
MGRFQMKALFVTTINFICEGMAIYSLAFLTKVPKYECQLTQDAAWSSCTQATTCEVGTKAAFAWRFDQNDDENLINWVHSGEMRCATGVEVGLIGTSYFVGVILGTLFLSLIADVYGRLLPLRVSLFNASLCYVLIYFLHEKILALYFIYFVFGITSPFRVGAGYIYSMEIIPVEK